MLFVLQDGLLFYQSYGSSYHLALLNISLPFACTEWLHCKEQENSILENKEIDVGFYFFPQRCGELGFQRSGAFLSCRNLRRSWCKHLCQPAGPGAFICSPTSSAPPSCWLLCQVQLGAERYLQNPAPRWRKRCQQLNVQCLQHRLGRVLLGTPTPRAVNF